MNSLGVRSFVNSDDFTESGRYRSDDSSSLDSSYGKSKRKSLLNFHKGKKNQNKTSSNNSSSANSVGSVNSLNSNYLTSVYIDDVESNRKFYGYSSSTDRADSNDMAILSDLSFQLNRFSNDFEIDVLEDDANSAVGGTPSPIRVNPNNNINLNNYDGDNSLHFSSTIKDALIENEVISSEFYQ